LQLLFVRHAQSQNNDLWVQTQSNLGRSDDPELTDLGKSQTRHLAEFLSKCLNSDHSTSADSGDLKTSAKIYLYCSLMIRSIQTGLILSKALKLPLLADLEIHENGGIYLENETTGELVGLPGKTRSFFEQHFPSLVLPPEMPNGGWWERPFEERTARYPRAQKVLKKMLEKHAAVNDTVILVGHAGFYNTLLKTILQMPQDISVMFKLLNAAVTFVQFDEDYLKIHYMNRNDFLPKNLVS